jgi:hypothetical protein
VRRKRGKREWRRENTYLPVRVSLVVTAAVFDDLPHIGDGRGR